MDDRCDFALEEGGLLPRIWWFAKDKATAMRDIADHNAIVCPVSGETVGYFLRGGPIEVVSGEPPRNVLQVILACRAHSDEVLKGRIVDGR